MNSSKLFIARKKRIFKRFFELLLFITLVLIIYYFVRSYLNPNYELNYASIFGYLMVIIWISFSEASIRKLEFDDKNEELIITKKSFFGTEKFQIVKYFNLEFKVKNRNKFWAFLFGKKRLNLLTNNVEVVKVRSTEEFNVSEIENMEKTLAEIKERFIKPNEAEFNSQTII